MKTLIKNILNDFLELEKHINNFVENLNEEYFGGHLELLRTP